MKIFIDNFTYNKKTYKYSVIVSDKSYDEYIELIIINDKIGFKINDRIKNYLNKEKINNKNYYFHINSNDIDGEFCIYFSRKKDAIDFIKKFNMDKNIIPIFNNLKKENKYLDLSNDKYIKNCPIFLDEFNYYGEIDIIDYED